MSPGTLDPGLVKRHLDAIEEMLELLRPQRGKPLEDLTGDAMTMYAVEHLLQLCAQNALDIATHLLATAGRSAKDYKESLLKLRDVGILPREFASRFAEVASFRNVLVHAYLDVDPAIVHRHLNERLDDFVEFARHVLEWLDRQK